MAAWDRIISALLQFNIQFGWRDLVDIIIVAYVFYRLILIIRGTRAEQLIKGVVLLLVAMIASDIVGFNTLHWLLKSVMTVGLIAIPIVFQPELRRALEHLGRESCSSAATGTPRNLTICWRSSPRPFLFW